MVSPISKTIKFSPQTDKLLTVAAGCFWGTEHIYRKYFDSKIKDCKVGYANGDESSKDQSDSISYKRVCSGKTQFAEVLQISFDPKIVSLKELVDFFFRIHDPTTVNSQGPDVGTQYRSAIFANSQEDLDECRKLKEQWQPKWGNNIAVSYTHLDVYKRQQHQQHMNFQSSNPVGSSSSTISAHSVSWNSNGISAPSPNSGRSPRSPFDLFSSSQEPHSRPASRKQHTSLLSLSLIHI